VIGFGLFGRTVGHLARVIGSANRRHPRRPDQRACWRAEESRHARLVRWPLIGVMHWLVFVGFSLFAPATRTGRCSSTSRCR
jgi:hypothetical protein